MSRADTIPPEDIELMKKMKRDGATCREIGKETGWSNNAVAHHTKDVTKKWKDPEWLRERRRGRGMTCREIAKEVPVGEAAISKWCNKYDIVPEWQDEEACRELYWEEEMSTVQLGERWDMTHSSARRALIVAGVDRRDPVHGNPGDGIGGASDYGDKWDKVRAKAIERDNLTCQEDGCEEEGLGLDVHHIKPVSSFDNPEDSHYLENLVTLCRSHHKERERDIRQNESEVGKE